MKVGFGRYAEEDVRRLILERPDYIRWLLDRPAPRGPLVATIAEVRRYIRVLDAKPLHKECRGEKAGGQCTSPPTYGAAYLSGSTLSVDLSWWCRGCSPYQFGADRVVVPVRNYEEALLIVSRNGKKPDYRTIIGCLSMAKGMSEHATDAALDSFFGP